MTKQKALENIILALGGDAENVPEDIATKINDIAELVKNGGVGGGSTGKKLYIGIAPDDLGEPVIYVITEAETRTIPDPTGESKPHISTAVLESSKYTPDDFSYGVLSECLRNGDYTSTVFIESNKAKTFEPGVTDLFGNARVILERTTTSEDENCTMYMFLSGSTLNIPINGASWAYFDNKPAIICVGGTKTYTMTLANYMEWTGDGSSPISPGGLPSIGDLGGGGVS